MQFRACSFLLICSRRQSYRGSIDGVESRLPRRPIQSAACAAAAFPLNVLPRNGAGLAS